MKIPKLSLSKIREANIPTGKYGLSPSQVSYLVSGCVGCEVQRLKLKEAYAGCTEAYCLLMTNPFAPIEGIVLHRLANYCIGQTNLLDDDVFDQAEKFLNEERNKLVYKWQMLNPSRIKLNFGKVSALLDSRSSKNSDNQISEAVGHLSCERSIDCISSLGLIGTPDYLWINGDNAVIKDYKTGELTDTDGNIKESFRIQLNLYRIMVINKYPYVKNVRMFLDNLAGRIERIDEIDDQKLLNILATLQQSIQAGSFSPGESCRQCRCRHICQYRQWTEPRHEEYFDFRGKIAIKNNSIYLTDNSLNITTNIARTDISAYLYDALSSLEGRTVYLTNIKRCSDNPLIGQITASTLACEIEK